MIDTFINSVKNLGRDFCKNEEEAENGDKGEELETTGNEESVKFELLTPPRGGKEGAF